MSNDDDDKYDDVKVVQYNDEKHDIKQNKGQEYCLEAHCLLYGHGIEPSVEDALYWYEKSAYQNEPRAMVSLGNLYYEGTSVRKNQSKGLEYYLKAIDLDEPQA